MKFLLFFFFIHFPSRHVGHAQKTEQLGLVHLILPKNNQTQQRAGCPPASLQHLSHIQHLLCLSPPSSGSISSSAASHHSKT
uniref:Secreted protein n=1 Tax=Globodera rostochiensis TaxID=31243 RepID=A0A914HGZ3_GLORO